MPNEVIDLTHQQLIEICEDAFWANGGEGNVYRIFLGGNKRILLKLFYSPYKDIFFLPKATLENKEKKVEYLSSITLPNQVQIYSSVKLEGEFIGYMMNEAINYEPFCFNTYSLEQKIIFLNKLKKQLTRFHELGIVFGDLKSDNVLSHQTNYKLGAICDLDNMKINDYRIDVMSPYMDEFLYQYGIVDENLDWYVLNLLTLEAVHKLDLTTYAAYEETRNFMDKYRGKSEALRKMQMIRTDFNGDLLLDDPNFYEELDIPYTLKKV